VNSEIDVMKYYIASEKALCMISSIDMFLQCMEEFKIKPEEDVIHAISPKIIELNKWLESK
jgi:hypothetical protein